MNQGVMSESALLSSIYIILVISCLFCSGYSAVKAQQSKKVGAYDTYAVEISLSNFSANHRDWEKDMAIMFYIPSCKYCRQLATSWEQIAAATSTTRDLVVTKFNCERSKENTDLCLKLNVDRYPSVYFMGYGDLHQSPPGNPFTKNPLPRLARYNADLYPEAIYDWVRMLSQISTSQRSWDDIKSIFTGRSRTKKTIKRLENKVRKLDLFVTFASNKPMCKIEHLLS